MARKTAPEPETQGARNGAYILRYASGTAMVVALTLGATFALTRVEQFFISDPRMILPALPEGATSGPNFRVYGLTHAPEDQVVDVFQHDFHRSLYLCPIADWRIQLMRIEWVKEASVSRVWPNSLVIRIQERTPVAFARIGGEAARIALIDSEGVLMNPGKNLEDFNVPVITGIRGDDTLDGRKQRVSRYLKLRTDFGDAMDKISEVDVSDTENLKVTQQFDDHVYTLMLGNRDFLKRLTNFTSNYQEIKKKIPEDSTLLDLRLADRIIFEPGNGAKPHGK